MEERKAKSCAQAGLINRLVVDGLCLLARSS
jgi:hypothetical protein